MNRLSIYDLLDNELIVSESVATYSHSLPEGGDTGVSVSPEYQKIIQTLFHSAPFPPPQSPKFTFIDLFAGIGGFRLALQGLGGRCVYSSEWNKEAKKVYSVNYGDIPYGDITLPETKLYIPRRYDILTAGFPCQPFSISGKMKGFEDTRGTLIYDVFEIIDKTLPPVVLLENVKHLRDHDKGKTLQVIVHSLKELGYLVSWKILNASNFGVPQNRERIIIVATKEREFSFDVVHEYPHKVSLKDFLDKKADFEYLQDPYTLIEDPTKQKSGLIFAGYRNKKIRQKGVRKGTEHLSRVHKQPNRIYSSAGIHPALPSQEVSGRFWILDEGRVRKLTINECYRIMGFPDNFIKSLSLSESYRQIGNSVCVPMVSAIMQAIIDQGLISNQSKQ